MRASAFVVAGAAGALAGLITCVRAPPSASPIAVPTTGPAVEAYLLDNGFHTDLALPRAALERRDGPLGEAVRGLPPGDWVLVGWGDARFYVDESPIRRRLPDGARAFFRPGNPSVVMLDPETAHPLRRFPEQGRLAMRLSADGFQAAAARIEVSLATDAQGRPRLSRARPGGGARFFRSRETFWLGHLCNHWSAEVLNAAGAPIRPYLSLTSGEVMRAAAASPLAASPKAVATLDSPAADD